MILQVQLDSERDAWIGRLNTRERFGQPHARVKRWPWAAVKAV